MPSRRSSPILPLLLWLWLGPLAPGCSRPGADPFPPVGGDVTAVAAPVETMDDPRLSGLLRAAEGWRKARGPARTVIDKVVLVPDVPEFFFALAAWDQSTFFPILIDDPRWTIPFLRAFRPARIVRRPPLSGRRAWGDIEEWAAAGEAIGRAWVGGESGSTPLPPFGARPDGLGPTPPGVVLSHPGSPALAGAAALAAGRFQPLLRLDRIIDVDRDDAPLGFGETLSEGRAVEFARQASRRVASVAENYAEIGDEVDFLTLAGDWPYRYNVADGPGLGRGDRALDDLIGRDPAIGPGGEEGTWGRWAFTGRLVGDAPSSIYRAMASLFLQPESALLWNTYGGGHPWSDYDVAGAAVLFGVVRPGGVEARAGDGASLTAWHAVSRLPNGRDLLHVNSSGSPTEFAITGGTGTPADVPFWSSSVVSMVHSFSAADPANADTIAGRFLDRGAFAYFGSMNEPYLISFRTPYLASKLMVAEVPLGAALRQGPGEGFGFPWRLAYLGDPLYRLDPNPAGDRPAREAPGPPSPGAVVLSARPGPASPDAAATLDWCHDAALLAASTFGVAATPEVLKALVEIDRGRLDPRRRDRLDILLIDRFLAAGDVSGLLDRLLRIPPAERSPTVWRAIETAALDLVMARLGEGEFEDALNLWARMASGPWRPEADFPVEVARRIADSIPPARVASLRGRLDAVLAGPDSAGVPADRRRMLEEKLRSVDKSQAR